MFRTLLPRRTTTQPRWSFARSSFWLTLGVLGTPYEPGEAAELEREQ
jgi:hypothetical protein